VSFRDLHFFRLFISKGESLLRFRVTVKGTSFNGIPGVCTVIADPGARFLHVVCIRIPA
jgi:hypothetical protein